MRKWMIFCALLSGLVSAFVWLVLDTRFIALQPPSASAEELEPTEGSVSEDSSLERQVLNTQISADIRASLEEKIELSRNLNEQMVNLSIPSAEKIPPRFNAMLGSGGETESFETGIFPGSDGMIKPEQAKINNYWQGQAGNEKIFIFAGSLPDDETAGRVVCIRINAADVMANPSVTIFDTPISNGSLRVMDSSDGTIALNAADGTAYFFDLATNSLRQ